METIPKTDCTKIGFLQKPHGIKGDIVLQLEEDYTESLEEYPTFFLEIDQLLVPFFPTKDGIRIRSTDSALVRFKWIEDEIDVKRICGTPVFLKNEVIILNEEEIGLHNLIGFILFDETLGKIGEIEQVDDFAGNLVLQVKFKNAEVLVPFNEDFLVRFDEKKREIELQCPEGIFEID